MNLINLLKIKYAMLFDNILPTVELGEGNGNPLEYSCLENLVDRRALWAIVHGVAMSQTRVSMHAPHIPGIIDFSLSLEYWSYFICSERRTYCVLLSMSIINWIKTHLYE